MNNTPSGEWVICSLQTIASPSPRQFFGHLSRVQNAVIITRLKSIAYNLHAEQATAKINIKSLSALSISSSQTKYLSQGVCCIALT